MQYHSNSALTLVELLERNARELPEKPALISTGHCFTYNQLNEAANRLADSLLAMGLKKHDHVVIMLPRIGELVTSFLGVNKAAGVAVPMNSELPPERIRGILENTDPKCIIVHSPHAALIRKSMPPGSDIRVVVVGRAVGRHASFDELLSKASPNNPDLSVDALDTSYLNYTSGSTGQPKGAIATHANIYWNTAASVEALDMTADDVHLCMFAPFAHPHEIIARPLYLGGTMVLVDKIYPKSLAEAISDHKVTCVMGLSPMFDKLLAVLKHTRYDLSSLRIPESGGMYTQPELIERFERQVGVPIIPVWGSTESTGVALANRPGARPIPGSVGKPCPHYRVKVIDDHGSEVPANQVGQMIVSGPAVVGGYHDNQRIHQVCFRDGWYYTGDLVKKDEQGNFFFVARQNEMMKVAGLKVYPLEIELACLEHPGIAEAAVVPAKDSLRGEVPKAIVVAKEGVQLTYADLMSFWRQRLAHYKVPRIVQIRESLPRSAGSDKIDKKVLRLESA